METTNDKCGEIGSMVDSNNIKWWNENPAVDIKLKTGFMKVLATDNILAHLLLQMIIIK